MIKKRFVDDGFEAIEEQSFTDIKTDKTYYVDYFDEIIDLANQLSDENEQLKEQLKECLDARKAYKADWKACVSYCDIYEDEIHTYKDNIERLKEENDQLKKELKSFKPLYFESENGVVTLYEKVIK